MTDDEYGDEYGKALMRAAEERLRELPPGHGLIVRLPPEWPHELCAEWWTVLKALANEVNPDCSVVIAVPAEEIVTCSMPDDIGPWPDAPTGGG